MLARHPVLARVGGDERLRGVPSEEVDGESQPVLMVSQEGERAIEMIAYSLGRDKKWQCQVRLSLKAREHGFAGKSRLVGGYGITGATQRQVCSRTIDVCLCVVEVVRQGEVLFEQTKRDFGVGTGKMARLNAQVLRFSPRTAELLAKCALDFAVPRGIPKPVSHALVTA